MENESMRKWILAAVFSMVAASTASAGGTSGGFDGTVIANVYEYLAAHGCPAVGFGLANCSPYDPPAYRHYKPRHVTPRTLAPRTESGTPGRTTGHRDAAAM
jgi:hypothetical protein